jgi:hypothetical protein
MDTQAWCPVERVGETLEADKVCVLSDVAVYDLDLAPVRSYEPLCLIRLRVRPLPRSSASG